MIRSLIAPGPRNSITDVAGIRVGNAEMPPLTTGTTVVIPERVAGCAVDVRGGGPGTRDTEALDPAATVQEVHAIALSGGSAYGLDAAGGVMHWLRRQGVGYRVADAVVPIVPGAIIFDLLTRAPKDWDRPPWWQLGHDAAAAASAEFALGNAGAGLGARAGRLKGGLGTASAVWEGHTVGALAVANAVGSAVIPGTRTLWAWPWELEGEFGHQTPPAKAPPSEPYDYARPPGTSTTLAVVATDATLTRGQARRVAIMAHDGMARALNPVHSPLDGDIVFVISTGARPLADPVRDLAQIGAIAADTTARAIARGVYEAQTLPGLASYPAYRDLK